MLEGFGDYFEEARGRIIMAVLKEIPTGVKMKLF
jgi:hypothetical protein